MKTKRSTAAWRAVFVAFWTEWRVWRAIVLAAHDSNQNSGHVTPRTGHCSLHTYPQLLLRMRIERECWSPNFASHVLCLARPYALSQKAPPTSWAFSLRIPTLVGGALGPSGLDPSYQGGIRKNFARRRRKSRLVSLAPRHNTWMSTTSSFVRRHDGETTRARGRHKTIMIRV